GCGRVGGGGGGVWGGGSPGPGAPSRHRPTADTPPDPTAPPNPPPHPAQPGRPSKLSSSTVTSNRGRTPPAYGNRSPEGAAGQLGQGISPPLGPTTRVARIDRAGHRPQGGGQQRAGLGRQPPPDRDHPLPGRPNQNPRRHQHRLGLGGQG